MIGAREPELWSFQLVGESVGVPAWTLKSSTVTGQPNTITPSNARQHRSFDFGPDVAALMSGWRAPFAVFFCWRLVHGLIVVASGGSFFSSAFQFDARYYLEIAQHGYILSDPTYGTFQSVAFFPAFPVLAAPFIKVFGIGLGGALVANGLALAAFVTVWGVSRSWCGERIARLSIVTMALWPASMFLWAFYTESFFVVLTAGAFWADRRGRAWLAVPLVFLAGLTRSVGLVFGPVIVAARLWRLRRVDRTAVGYMCAWLSSVMVLMLTMRVVAGDWLAFSSAQRAWGRTPSSPWVPISDGVKHVVSELPRIAQETSMNLASTLLFLGLGVWGTCDAIRSRSEDESRPLEPGLWALSATMVPQFTSLISGMLRFMVSSWSGFVLLARLTNERTIVRWTMWVLFAAVSVLLLHRYASNTFVA